VSPLVWFYTLSALTLADSAGTLALLSLGGRELNPLHVAMIETVGPVHAMSLRAIAGVAGAGVLSALSERSSWRWPLRVAGVALGAVVGMHTLQLWVA